MRMNKQPEARLRTREQIRAEHDQRKQTTARKLWTLAKTAAARWALACEDRWARDCARDGLLQSRQMRYLRRSSQALRVTVRLLEVEGRPTSARPFTQPIETTERKQA